MKLQYVFLFVVSHRAIDAISLTWDNSHLKLILAHDNLSASNEPHSTNNINPLGQPLWHGKYCRRHCLLLLLLLQPVNLCLINITSLMI